MTNLIATVLAVLWPETNWGVPPTSQAGIRPPPHAIEKFFGFFAMTTTFVSSLCVPGTISTTIRRSY
jgi:hypothetical protein